MVYTGGPRVGGKGTWGRGGGFAVCSYSAGGFALPQDFDWVSVVMVSRLLRAIWSYPTAI